MLILKASFRIVAVPSSVLDYRISIIIKTAISNQSLTWYFLQYFEILKLSSKVLFPKGKILRKLIFLANKNKIPDHRLLLCPQVAHQGLVVPWKKFQLTISNVFDSINIPSITTEENFLWRKKIKYSESFQAWWKLMRSEVNLPTKKKEQGYVDRKIHAFIWEYLMFLWASVFTIALFSA